MASGFPDPRADGVLRVPATNAERVEVRFAPVLARDTFDPADWRHEELSAHPDVSDWYELNVDDLDLADGRYEYEFLLHHEEEDDPTVAADPFAESITRFQGYRGTFRIRGGERFRPQFSWDDELPEDGLPSNEELVIYEFPPRWADGATHDNRRNVADGDFQDLLTDRLVPMLLLASAIGRSSLQTVSRLFGLQATAFIYGLEGGFKELIDKQAVNLVHPDLGSAGGILETKRIGDYAEEHGVAMMLHYAGSPVGYFASAHAAAATQNFTWLEHHSVENDDWYNLIAGDTVAFDEGYVPVPDDPGLGVELNEDVIEELLIEGEEMFAPTPEWDEMRSWDRLWS